MAYLSYHKKKRLGAFLCLQTIALSSSPAFAAADAGVTDTLVPPQSTSDMSASAGKAGRGETNATSKDTAKDTAANAVEDVKSQAAPNPISEISPELAKKLQELESHFFGHIYTTEPVEHRLTRLERFVFGTETGGPFPTRIDRLASTLNVSDPDGTKREIKLKPKEDPKPQTASNTSSGGNTSNGGNDNNINNNNNNSSDQAQGASNNQMAVVPVTSVIPAVVGSQPDEPVIQKTDLDEPPTYRRTVAISAPVSLSQKPKILSLQVTKSMFTTAGKPNDVIRELDQAIRVHPSDPELFFERAKAYIQMDKLSNALNDLSDAIRDQPNKSDYYIARAWCYKKLGNSYLAADDIKQARFVDPGLPAQIDLLQNNKVLAPAESE